jgi:hypothetical protein
VGFVGDPVFVAHAPEEPTKKDGTGLTIGWGFGPGQVLFFPTYDNYIGEIKPGSLNPDRYVPVKDVGLSTRALGLGFVPAGMPGAGRLKFSSYQTWLDTGLEPDGTGTYNVLKAAKTVALGGKGFAFVPAGRPLFPRASLLYISSDNDVQAYEVDANGDPLAATARLVLSDLSRTINAVLDPLTDDILISAGFPTGAPLFALTRAMAAPIQVRLTQPADGTAFVSPASILLTAEASQTGGAISRVEFYQGTNLLNTLRPSAIYQRQAGPFLGGAYAFTAVAYDGSGNAATSTVVHVTVVNDGPRITLLQPTNNATFPACSDIHVQALVTPGNVLVTNVVFYDGNLLLRAYNAADKFNPLSATEQHAEDGPRLIWVAATDKLGLTALAVATNVVIQTLPLHQLAIHHFQPAELMFCFNGLAGSNYVWESASAVAPAVWRPYLTNQTPAVTLRFTNRFDAATPAGFFRTRSLK